MQFKDILVSREYRFSIGIEEESGKFYVSIPVSNQLVDYEEYYEIDKPMFDQFSRDMKSAIPFVEKCRVRQMDHLLMQQPGTDRGVAV